MFARLFGIFALALAAAGLWMSSTDEAAAQTGYTLKPGDVLRIEVLEDPNLNRETLVLPGGTISFPLAGTIQAGGRTVSEVESAITQALAGNFAAEPNVFVSVAQLAERDAPRAPSAPAPDPVIDTYIMGEVNQPGRKEVSPGTTILQLLAEAGGLTNFAAETRIELRRTYPSTGESRVYYFSYTGRANGPRIAGSTQLSPGDVVVVPQRRLFE